MQKRLGSECASEVDIKNFNPLSTNPIKRQTHSNNSSAVVDEFFECVTDWPFCGVGTQRVKIAKCQWKIVESSAKCKLFWKLLNVNYLISINKTFSIKVSL